MNKKREKKLCGKPKATPIHNFSQIDCDTQIICKKLKKVQLLTN